MAAGAGVALVPVVHLPAVKGGGLVVVSGGGVDIAFSLDNLPSPTLEERLAGIDVSMVSLLIFEGALALISFFLLRKSWLIGTGGSFCIFVVVFDVMGWYCC